MQVVNVKMDQVKGTCLLKHLLKQHNVMRELIHTFLVQAQWRAHRLTRRAWVTESPLANRVT